MSDQNSTVIQPTDEQTANSDKEVDCRDGKDRLVNFDSTSGRLANYPSPALNN